MTSADTTQHPLTRAAAPSPDVAAAGSRCVLATLVDVALALVTLLVAPLLGALGLAAGWAWTIAALLMPAVAAGVVLDLTRTGRSPGRRLLGVRTVGAASQLPPTVPELLGRRSFDADLRAGRDPLRLVPNRTVALPPRVWDGWQQARAIGTGPWLLVLDDGRQLPLAGPTLLGRDPSNEAGQHYSLVAVPDLSRSLSRVHALFEPTDDCLWLTDTGATNGTRAASPSPSGGTVIERWLRPGERVPVLAGAVVHLGDRELRVTRSIGG